MSKEIISEVSRMKNLFGYKRGVVISEQANNSDALAKQIYDELSKASKFSVTHGGTNEKDFENAIKKINSKEVLDKLNNLLTKTGGVGGLIQSQFSDDEKYIPFLRRMGNHFYTLGIWVKNWYKPNGFKLPQLSPNSATSTTAPATTTPDTAPATTNKSNTPKFTPEPKTLDDQNNVLKKGMTGSKIKQLQQFIGLTGKSGQPLITGNFGGLTDTKLKELYPNEYSTDKGVNLTLFNKITSLKKQVTNVDKVEPAKPVQPIDPTTMQPIQPTNATQTVTAPAVTGVNQSAATTPGDYYKTLYNAGLIQGEGNNRVRYKGPELNDEQQKLLTQYMDSAGYDFNRKGRDKRLVYVKR